MTDQLEQSELLMEMQAALIVHSSEFKCRISQDVVDIYLRSAIAVITAQASLIEALRNPPYKVQIRHDKPDWKAIVMLGDAEVFASDWWPYEHEAREQAQFFIDKLTAHLVAKK